MTSSYKKLKQTFKSNAPKWLFYFLYGTRACIKNTYILMIKYGFLKSTYSRRSIDHVGNPIPWFTYSAIEYLEQLDISNCSLFEYGSGNSTLYWAKKTKTVLSVEDNESWKDEITPNLSNNASIIFAEKKNDYIQSITTANKEFDIIVVDGSYRYECAKAAVDKLSKTGVIILDDSDDHLEAMNHLIKSNLIKVDFCGFTPIVSFTKTTSFFLKRDFNLSSTLQETVKHSIYHY